MKLIPQVKPVRIRISCDGQEHFLLASLRRSFRCNEVAELLGAPLVKWLKQQNESEVAKRVKSLIDRKEKSPVELASAFFLRKMASTRYIPRCRCSIFGCNTAINTMR